MGYAVRFEGVTKRYARGGPRYASLRHDLAGVVSRLGQRLRGHRPEPRGTLALEDVSFEVQEGESFAIVGPNGAGKTTALKLISRILYPTSGRIRVRGRVGALIEVGSGVHPELTARENIWLYGQILGMTRSDIRRRFDEIVEFAELGHVLDTPVKMYSSGMQLRLGFAIASHLDPDVFVVDEALAVGDAGFQVKCVQRMSKLVVEGRTLLFVSHTLPLVREVCRRAILLDSGRLVHDGMADEVVDAYLRRVGAGIAARCASGESLDVIGLRIAPVAARSARLRTGDAVQIDVELAVCALLPDVVLGIGITDGRPGNLVTMSMLSEGMAVELGPGHHLLTCAVGALPLLPGAYEVWFSAASSRKALYYSTPKVIGTLFVADGPTDRRGDLLFAQTGGFGPVHVPYTMVVGPVPRATPAEAGGEP